MGFRMGYSAEIIGRNGKNGVFSGCGTRIADFNSFSEAHEAAQLLQRVETATGDDSAELDALIAQMQAGGFDVRQHALRTLNTKGR